MHRRDHTTRFTPGLITFADPLQERVEKKRPPVLFFKMMVFGIYGWSDWYCYIGFRYRGIYLPTVGI